MATSDSPLSIDATRTLQASASAPAPPPATGTPLVRFDFANGDTPSTPSINDTGFSFNGPMPIEQAPNGKSGMRFLYTGTTSIYGDAGFPEAEQRYNIGQYFTDLYIKKKFYIPTNYKMRAGGELLIEDGALVSNWQAGDTVQLDRLVDGVNFTATVEAIEDGPGEEKVVVVRDVPGGGYGVYQWGYGSTTNITRSSTVEFYYGRKIDTGNKFHTFWSRSTNYATSNGTTILGFRVAQPGYTGAYKSSTDNAYRDTPDYGGNGGNGDVTDFIRLIDPDTDLGREVEFVIRVKRSTTLTSYDAITEIWKDGELAHSAYNGRNFVGDGDNTFGKGYILGYSNSGFDVDTTLFMPLFEVWGATKPPGLVGGEGGDT